MSQLQNLALAILTITASAETVLWKSSGQITEVGAAFQDSGITAGDELKMRMTYSDQAVPKVLKLTTIGGSSASETAYLGGLALRISITVGSLTWEGLVATGTDATPPTFFVKETTFSLPESIATSLRSTNGAQFTSFPSRQEGSPSLISLDFRSATNQFLIGGISSIDLAPEFVTSATGLIQTGPAGSQMTFTLDLPTLEILNEADEPVPPIAPDLQTATTTDQFILRWQSDFRFRYRVESTTDLAAETWDLVETRNGTDTLITRTYPLTDQTLFYRVVALERPPLN